MSEEGELVVLFEGSQGEIDVDGFLMISKNILLEICYSLSLVGRVIALLAISQLIDSLLGINVPIN